MNMEGNALKQTHECQGSFDRKELKCISNFPVQYYPEKRLPQDFELEESTFLNQIITQPPLYINQDSRRLQLYLIRLLDLPLNPKYQNYDNYQLLQNGPGRIVFKFISELETMFPLTSPQQKIKLRLPVEFADKICIHVNHLNRSIKEVTGKTTSYLISERIFKEAINLLQISDWSISDISWSLGFSESAHFTNFFKKKSGLNPRAFRNNFIIKD